jgi:ribosomal protein S18 acetylase RimI-like enzyme
MKNLLVRRATCSDVKKLTELRILLQQHCEESNRLIWRITAEGKTLLREKVENELADNKRHVLVAEMNGEIVGFIQGEIERRTDYLPGTVGSISTAYVVGKFRRTGVGRILVKHLSEFFSSEGVEDVTLRYIIGNEEAERFWQKLGFQPVITTAKMVLEKLKSGTSVSTSE